MKIHEAQSARETLISATTNVEDWHAAARRHGVANELRPVGKESLNKSACTRRSDRAEYIFAWLWCSPGIRRRRSQPSSTRRIYVRGEIRGHGVLYPGWRNRCRLRRPNKFLFVNVAADRLDKCARKYGAPSVPLIRGEGESTRVLRSCCLKCEGGMVAIIGEDIKGDVEIKM